MTKSKLFLFGLVIGCFTFSIFLIEKNKELEKENFELKDDNNYLTWQLKEVPTIIESHKEEICSE